MFKNTTVFEGSEAKNAKDGLPTLPEGLAYRWEESNYAESWWRGGGVINEIRYTLGELGMVFRTKHLPEGESYTFTVTDKRWGLSNAPVSSVSELGILIQNEIQHLMQGKGGNVVV